MKKYKFGIAFLLTMFMAFVFSPTVFAVDPPHTEVGAVTVIRATAVDPVVAETDNYERFAVNGLVIDSQSCIASGENVTFSISINNAPNKVNAFGLNITFNENVLEFVKFIKRADLADFMVSCNKKPTQSILTVGGYYTGPENFGLAAGASGKIGEVVFRVKSCELATLAISNMTDDIIRWPVQNGNLLPEYPPLEPESESVCPEKDTGQLDIKGTAGKTGKEIEIPVRIQSAPKAIAALGFQVIYPKTILTYVGYTRGELVKNFNMFDVYLAPLPTDAATAGRLKVGGFNDVGIPQGSSGCVVYLRFKIAGSEEGVCYPLTLDKLVDDLKEFSSTGGYFYIDNTPPNIFCPTERAINQVDSTGTPADNPDVLAFLSEATAIDNIDGEVEVFHFILGSISFDAANFNPADLLNQPSIPLAILPHGRNTIVFIARDKAGNISFCVSAIIIQPITCVEDASGKIDIPGTTGKTGQEVWIPVRVQGIMPNNPLSNFSFEVPYNPSVLEYKGYERGNLTTNFPLFDVIPLGMPNSGRLIVEGMSGKGYPDAGSDIYNDLDSAPEPGILKSSGEGAEIIPIPTPISGEIVLLRFMVKSGMNGSCYPLKLENLTDSLAGLPATGGCFCIHNCNGDINDDGMVTPADALIVFRCYLTSCDDCPCCDVNGDGTITPNDALCIFRYYLGQPSCLDNIITSPGSPGGFSVGALGVD